MSEHEPSDEQLDELGPEGEELDEDLDLNSCNDFEVIP